MTAKREENKIRIKELMIENENIKVSDCEMKEM